MTEIADDRNTVGQGMALMALAVTVLPVIDAIAKLLSPGISPVQISVARFVIQSALAALFCSIGPWRGPMVNRSFAGHALRGILASTATTFFFAAVAVMPLANTLAIFFVEPMILTAMGALILKERVGPRRWIAVAVGLVGAMVVIRPNWSDFGAASLLPLGAAVTFAGYLLVTRRMAGTASAFAMQFMSGLSAMALMSAVLIVTSLMGIEGYVAVTMNDRQMVLLLAMGLVSFVSHLMVVAAFSKAPASVLAPLNYLEIVSATFLGLVLFGDFPDTITWLGIALIVASGLYIAHRERASRRRIAPRPLQM